MATEKVNGVRVHYGPRDVEDKAPSLVRTASKVKEMVISFNYDDLPAVDADDALVLEIPAGAWLKSATLRVTTAFAGGTSYNIGLYEKDGTVIDADGIDAGVLLAALTDGAVIACDGALVGAEIGAAAGQVVVAATGTFTAGSADLVIEYVD